MQVVWSFFSNQILRLKWLSQLIDAVEIAKYGVCGVKTLIEKEGLVGG
ncbi:MAG: hypothetical protein WAX04_00670 [Oscillospiraceae bacterium]